MLKKIFGIAIILCLLCGVVYSACYQKVIITEYSGWECHGSGLRLVRQHSPQNQTSCSFSLLKKDGCIPLEPKDHWYRDFQFTEINCTGTAFPGEWVVDGEATQAKEDPTCE